MPTERSGRGVWHGSSLGGSRCVPGAATPSEVATATMATVSRSADRPDHPPVPPYHGRSASRRGDLMRACFVNENIGGHEHAAPAPADRAGGPRRRRRSVRRRAPGRHAAAGSCAGPIPGLARLDLDASGFRDHVAGSIVARRRMGRLGAGDGACTCTRRASDQRSPGALRSHPSVIGTDATLLQSARLLPFREPTRFTDRVNGDGAPHRATRARRGHAPGRAVAVGRRLADRATTAPIPTGCGSCPTAS